MSGRRNLLSLLALVTGAAASVATSEMPTEYLWYGSAEGPRVLLDREAPAAGWLVELEVAADDLQVDDSDVRVLGELRGHGEVEVRVDAEGSDTERVQLSVDETEPLWLQVRPAWACDGARCISSIVIEIAAVSGEAEADWSVDAVAHAFEEGVVGQGDVVVTVNGLR